MPKDPTSNDHSSFPRLHDFTPPKGGLTPIWLAAVRSITLSFFVKKFTDWILLLARLTVPLSSSVTEVGPYHTIQKRLFRQMKMPQAVDLRLEHLNSLRQKVSMTQWCFDLVETFPKS